MKKLLKLGIETRPFFYPLHKQKILKKYTSNKKYKLPNTEFISKNGFYIPSGIGIKNEEIKFVIKKIKETIS